MARKKKDADWDVQPSSNGNYSEQGAALIVLMDLRDELKEANRHLGAIANQILCKNATAIPGILRTIEENTRRKPRVKRASV